MRFTVITIFPEMFPGPLGLSLLGKAMAQGILQMDVVDLRAYATDRHRTVDDAPFGGGGGMVMKPEPFFEAVEAAKTEESKIVLFGPQGKRLDHEMVMDFSRQKHLILLCGHYEGIDQRVREHLVDHEVSLGDYVLTGGELPAMVLIDAISRQIPGVVGDQRSVERDSFYNGLLDHPHYTRPRVYRGFEVPEMLLSGDHAKIERWRRQQSLLATAKHRPDLLQGLELPPQEARLLEEGLR